MNDIQQFLKKLSRFKTTDDETLDSIILEARLLWADYLVDMYRKIDFSGASLREHFEARDEQEIIEGLTDEDLDEAGEWALNSGFMWDSVYAAWEYGIEMVRKEKDEK